MRRAGLNVTTVGVKDIFITGSHNMTIKADILIDDINKDDMELLMLPGGPGHTALVENQNVQSLIDYAAKNDLYLAAICASPSVLGRKGLLDGKVATCFPGFEEYLTGAVLSDEKAVRDGKIITARGAGAAADFGFLIVETLLDKNTAAELKGVMQY